MTSDIHPHWNNTDPPASSTTEEGRRAPSHRVPIAEEEQALKIRKRERWTMVMPFGAVMFLLLFVFVGGVDFLRASLLDEVHNAPVETPDRPLPEEPPVRQSPAAPTIDLGEAAAPPQTGWPALLRINRYTVDPALLAPHGAGGGLVPAFPPTHQLPVHVVRETRDRIHGGAPLMRPPVRRQPETGPVLWVLGIMSAGLLPLFLRRA